MSADAQVSKASTIDVEAHVHRQTTSLFHIACAGGRERVLHRICGSAAAAHSPYTRSQSKGAGIHQPPSCKRPPPSAGYCPGLGRFSRLVKELTPRLAMRTTWSWISVSTLMKLTCCGPFSMKVRLFPGLSRSNTTDVKSRPEIDSHTDLRLLFILKGEKDEPDAPRPFLLRLAQELGGMLGSEE